MYLVEDILIDGLGNQKAIDQEGPYDWDKAKQQILEIAAEYYPIFGKFQETVPEEQDIVEEWKGTCIEFHRILRIRYYYPIQKGDRVHHVKDPDQLGTVTHLDRNLPHPTTCNVQWDGVDGLDIQWTNKLVQVEEVFYPIMIIQHVEPEEKYFIAYHPDFGQSACSAAGDTIEEAIENLHQIRREVLRLYEDEGITIPQPSK